MALASAQLSGGSGLEQVESFRYSQRFDASGMSSTFLPGTKLEKGHAQYGQGRGHEEQFVQKYYGVISLFVLLLLCLQNLLVFTGVLTWVPMIVNLMWIGYACKFGSGMKACHWVLFLLFGIMAIPCVPAGSIFPQLDRRTIKVWVVDESNEAAPDPEKGEPAAPAAVAPAVAPVAPVVAIAPAPEQIPAVTPAPTPSPEASKFCTSCGASMAVSAKFCCNCGAQNAVGSPPTPAPAPAAATVQPVQPAPQPAPQVTQPVQQLQPVSHPPGPLLSMDQLRIKEFKTKDFEMRQSGASVDVAVDKLMAPMKAVGTALIATVNPLPAVVEAAKMVGSMVGAMTKEQALEEVLNEITVSMQHETVSEQLFEYKALRSFRSILLAESSVEKATNGFSIPCFGVEKNSVSTSTQFRFVVLEDDLSFDSMVAIAQKKNLAKLEKFFG